MTDLTDSDCVVCFCCFFLFGMKALLRRVSSVIDARMRRSPTDADNVEFFQGKRLRKWEVAEESFVLLINENKTLPIRDIKSKKIALVRE